MSLYGGTAVPEDDHYVLNDDAIRGSMAEAIEEEMKTLYAKMKGKPMPEVGEEDRRLLFTAISRGVLKYLKAHEKDLISTITIRTPLITVTREVPDMTLDITVPNL